MPRVLLSAFGVHAGGGRVLLEALLRDLRPALRAAALDARLRGAVDLAGVPVDYVQPSLVARWRSLRTLAGRAEAGDVVFCFNGLPPLAKPAGTRVVVYMQGRHLVESGARARYPLRTAVRVAIERRWLQLGLRNCDEMWVQTPVMAELIRGIFPTLPVRIVPFVDDALAARLAAATARAPAAAPRPEDASFFYPAEGVAHKNHDALVRAWELLADQGCRPVLYLTLRAAEFTRLAARRQDAQAPRIVNLGPLERPAVLERLAGSTGLIFASSLESFGLPLLEARALGVPVLAAERDFVRAVCEPQQTFDPASPHSIADAVRRFLAPGLRREPPVLSARDVARMLAE